VVGYGRAEKHQVQQMMKLLLGLDQAPSPHDAADALAVAICHVHSMPPAGLKAAQAGLKSQAGLKARLYDAGAKARLHDTQAGLKARLYDTGANPRPESPVEADLQVRPAKSVEADLQVRLPRTWRQYRPPTIG